MSEKATLELLALEGKNFEVTTYRGYAKLCDLGRISSPDTYDEKINPGGIQRDLDKSHAKSAAKYAATGEGKLGTYRIWPEIFLNVRDPSIIQIKPIQKLNGVSLVRLMFDLKKIDTKRLTPQISRVDGNHRLYYITGDPDRNEWGPVEEESPFSLTIGLPVEEEQALFKDINDNQKGMNTSHLDNIVYRLKPEAKLHEENPAIWIGVRLHEDPNSPFHGLVYRGGVRDQGSKRPINLRSLQNGIATLLNDSKELRAMPGPANFKVQAQYKLIRDYWNAVKKIFGADWNAESLLLKGVGYRALSVVGAYIIDRCFREGKTETKDMEIYVEKLRKARVGEMTLNWDPDGPLAEFGGMKGAKIAAQLLVQSVAGIDESTVKQLAEEI